MSAIIVGTFGFIFLLLFDICSLRNRHVLKYIMLVFGISTIIYAYINLQQYNYQFDNSFVYLPIILALMIFFFGVLIYSIVIEVGLKTYQADPEHKLVTTGTYALVRHPGVIWLLTVFLLASLYYANLYLLLAGLVWTVVNVCYVVIQERLILEKIFAGYNRYKQETPMIIPNYQSIIKFKNQ